MKCRLLQWNCMYSEDMRAVAELIKQYDPDVVCLQELTMGYDQRWQDGARFIAERLGYNMHHAYGRMVLPDGQSTMMGTGIFSRFPMQHKQMVQLTRRDIESGGATADDRYYLQAELVIGKDTRLTVGTFHLPFHPRFITTPTALHAVKSIIDTTSAIQEVVLMGDLNRTPGTKAAKLLRGVGFRNIGPPLRTPTWTTKPFVIGPWQYDALKWRLDHLLYKGRGRHQHAQVIETDLSDHLPIMTELHLR